MTPYCTILLNPATKSDVLAACIQAAAAIQAGEEQAWATKLSGFATVVAGVLALIAGWLAYRAATEQNKQARMREKSRVTAYKAQLYAINERAWAEATAILHHVETGKKTSVNVMSIPLLRDELHPENWERHALLGENAIKQLTLTYESVYFLLVGVENSLKPLDAWLNQDEMATFARLTIRRCDELKELLD